MVKHRQADYWATVKRTDIWGTPDWLLPHLGQFDLDPCGCAERLLPNVTRTICPPEDGLALPWQGRVFINPPYHRGNIARWLAKMAAHRDGIALLFARTDTKAWLRHVWAHNPAVLLLYQRLRYQRVDGAVTASRNNSGAPSALVAYSVADSQCLRRMQEAGLGAVVTVPYPIDLTKF